MESDQSEETVLRTIMLLALVGLLDSLYLSYLHHLVAGGGGCPTQDLPGLDCGQVLASAEANMVGVPVAWLGVLGFLIVGGLALDRFLNLDRERTLLNRQLLPLVGLGGCALGAWLTYAEAFIIKQWCPFCLLAFGLTLALTGVALRAYGDDLRAILGR
ncbi:MAG: vitamin K epoxide reductase family protein [Candidatus Thermoplasmatota archaeon]|nr:vitamin K epoxide reductase family protein [Candidatus Thermoplasmatota archaeon]MEE3276781.1 vitamin K epoxide reductase family protein [Candidatus Thermoplasmatota archaeon]